MPKTMEIVPVDASQYAALALDSDALKSAFTENLDGESLRFGDLRRFKIPSGGGRMWTLPSADGGEPDGGPTFKAVILHTELGRTMWLHDSDDSEGTTPPDCTGGVDHNGIWHGSKSRRWISEAAKNSKLTERDYNGPRQNCDQCPFQQRGSGKNGGQKCQQKRAFYLATEDSLLPTILLAPVMSLDNAKKYLLSLSTTPVDVDGRRRTLNYKEVITEFGLESGKNSAGKAFSKITFRRAAVLPADQRQQFAAFADAIRPLIANIRGKAFDDSSASAPAEKVSVIYNDDAEVEDYDGFQTHSSNYAYEDEDGPTDQD